MMRELIERFSYRRQLWFEERRGDSLSSPGGLELTGQMPADGRRVGCWTFVLPLGTGS